MNSLQYFTHITSWTTSSLHGEVRWKKRQKSQLGIYRRRIGKLKLEKQLKKQYVFYYYYLIWLSKP